MLDLVLAQAVNGLVRLLLAGIEKAGGTGADAIVRGLEGARVGEGEFPVHFREWDHQLMHRVVVLKVKSQFTDPWDALEVAKNIPDAPGGLEALYGTRQETACAIGEL